MREIKETIEREVTNTKFRSFDLVYRIGVKNHVRYWLIAALVSLIIILFLPWTQNIRAKGAITTLRQEQRPQELNSIIPGRIIKWYVKEGDIVKAGDTIAQLAEIKDNYLDPELLNRTKEQINAKKSSVGFYGDKVAATDAQISAMQQVVILKMKQLSLKVIADSFEAVSAANDMKIAEAQFRRQKIMRDSGLSSLVQLEQRNQYYQSALAKKTSAEMKFFNTKTELIQAQAEFLEKKSKAQGEKAAAQSEISNSTADVAKLSNQYENYRIRNGMYYLIAPQGGQIVQANKSGLNEILKEGEKIAEIVPLQIDHAVEIYVRPVDLPLLSKGQKVRFLFDGYPAIVFSGWPKASYGIFSGEIAVIESSVSSNGKFRILVGEDKSYRPWPKTLMLGTGASAIALLKDVPVWYELWRNINGFPPEYYQTKEKSNDKGKK